MDGEGGVGGQGVREVWEWARRCMRTCEACSQHKVWESVNVVRRCRILHNILDAAQHLYQAAWHQYKLPPT